MLDAGRPAQRIAGLTLFRDHAEDDRFYMLPEVPGLIADPEPRLSLVLFRGEESGGLLQLEVRLAPTEAQIATASEALLATGHPPRLVRPDWRRGSFRLAGWLELDELAPLTLATTAPSLVGDPVAILSARLDIQAASLAAAALRGNSLPMVVIFELETLGLAGPLGIEVEADLQAIHDRWTAEGALTVPIGRARIAMTWEEFVRDRLIRIEVLDESGDVEGRRQEALRRVGQELIGRMLSPHPPSELPPQLDDEAVGAVELSFRLTARREELSTRSKWSFTERRAVPLKHYASASLIDLVPDRSGEQFIQQIDLTSAHRTLRVMTVPELDALGILALEVDLRRRGELEVWKSFALSDEQPEAQFETEWPSGTAFEYRVRARFDPEFTETESEQTAWIQAEGVALMLQPRTWFRPRALTLVARQVEFDWLDRIEVEARVGEQRARTVTLDSERRLVDLVLHGSSTDPIEVTVHWRGAEGEPSRSDDPREVSADMLFLDSPFGSSIRVLAIPLPLPGAVGMGVEMRLEHGEWIDQRTLWWDAPNFVPQRVALRRLQGAPDSYEYRLTTIDDAGTSTIGDWIRSSSNQLVLGGDEPLRVVEVEVVLLGGGPSARGSSMAELRMWSGEHEVRQVLEGDHAQARLVLALPEAAPPPEFEAREFLLSGEVVQTNSNPAERLIALPPPAPNSPS